MIVKKFREEGVFFEKKHNSKAKSESVEEPLEAKNEDLAEQKEQ